MREGKHAIVAMREGPQPGDKPKNRGDALASLTKDDIGLLYDMAKERAITIIRLTHERPDDKFMAEEATKLKRIRDTLWDAWKQRAA